MNAVAGRAVLHRLQRRPDTGASSPRTAFVLSGGASLGALQVGMLEALYERGIAPDFLVGTSVGALNAAFIASRPQAPQTARALGRVWRELQRAGRLPGQLERTRRWCVRPARSSGARPRIAAADPEARRVRGPRRCADPAPSGCVRSDRGTRAAPLRRARGRRRRRVCVNSGDLPAGRDRASGV